MAFDAPRFIIDIVDVYIAALVVIIIGVVEQTDTSNCCTVYSTLAQVRKKRSSIRFHVFWRMESMYNSSLVNTAAYRCGGAFTSAVADANTQTHMHNARNVFIKTHIYSWWLRINPSWDFRLHDCTGTHTHTNARMSSTYTCKLLGYVFARDAPRSIQCIRLCLCLGVPWNMQYINRALPANIFIVARPQITKRRRRLSATFCREYQKQYFPVAVRKLDYTGKANDFL